MDLTKSELSKLINYTAVFRWDCERKIRRIRRNKDMLDKRFNEIPTKIAEEDGIASPDEEIEMLKESKAEAVIIKKKLELAKK